MHWRNGQKTGDWQKLLRQREKQMLDSIASAEEKRKFEEAERKRREEEEYQEMLRAEVCLNFCLSYSTVWEANIFFPSNP